MSRNLSLGNPARWLGVLMLCVAVVGALLWQGRASSAADATLAITFSHPAGRYDDTITLELSTTHPEATIYYTLDGTLPDPATSASYETPLTLDAAEPQVTAVRAQAFLPDGSSGPMASSSYVMGLETGMPVVSLIADPADLWDEERGIYVNHYGRGREWERPVDVTYVTADGQDGFHVGAGLRIHGDWTRWFFDKKSLRLYFRDVYGTRKLQFPVFGESGQTMFDHLYLHNSDQDLLLFRNQLTERLFQQIGGYAVRGHPVLLFLNGRPWGIYNLRERIDERFLRETYGVPAAAITDTPNIPSRQSAAQRARDLPHWENFMAFVEANDLSDPQNYAYLQTQIDLPNFVDYYLLEMYVANTDWPHHNVHQFRPWTPGGRWEWMVWDNDLAFERVDRQMVDHVLDVQHRLGIRMEVLLNKLLDNPEFYNLFLTRAADLLNTTLSPENVSAEVEYSIAQLEADVPLEQARWNVPEDWELVKGDMRTFAADRTDIMRRHFVESFGLEGTAVIRVEAAGSPEAWLAVNDLAAQRLPWEGVHFIGTEIRLLAVPSAGYAFSQWQGYAGPDDPNQPEVRLPVTQDTTLVAHFVPLDGAQPQAHDVRITGYHVDGEGGIEGDWFELRVDRPAGVDLRGWRLTDNDAIAATDEGSLIFSDDPLFADLRQGNTVRVIATKSIANDARFPEDGWQNGVLVVYAGNGRLDDRSDPWFNLGPKDNLLLLAPGLGESFVDDIPIDLWTTNKAVQAVDFGLPPD